MENAVKAITNIPLPSKEAITSTHEESHYAITAALLTLAKDCKDGLLSQKEYLDEVKKLVEPILGLPAAMAEDKIKYEKKLGAMEGRLTILEQRTKPELLSPWEEIEDSAIVTSSKMVLAQVPQQDGVSVELTNLVIGERLNVEDFYISKVLANDAWTFICYVTPKDPATPFILDCTFTLLKGK